MALRGTPQDIAKAFALPEEQVKELLRIAGWHPPPPTKRCTRCGAVKPLAEFHPRASARDGHQARCKTCERARVRSWQERKRLEMGDAAYRARATDAVRRHRERRRYVHQGSGY